MADIKKELNTIEKSVYGKEMRPAIHDALYKVNQESEKAYGAAVSGQESSKTAAKAAEAARKEAEEYAKAAQAVAGVKMATEELPGLAMPDGKTLRISGSAGMFYAANSLFGKTIIFFGTSITWGEKADEDGMQVEKPYPAVFGDITGATVINAAVRGATASSVQENNFAAQIEAHRDDIAKASHCAIEFMPNDFSKAVGVGNEKTPQSFYADYLAGIESILAINPAIEIIILLSPRGKGYTINESWVNGNGEIIDNYIDAVIDIATLKRLRIVDLGNVGINEDNAELYYPNGHNHMTQEGYNLIGEHIAKTYLTGTYHGRTDIYNKGIRVAANQLAAMTFPNPLETQKNSYYDGIYWEINRTDEAGITSQKNVRIESDNFYHLEFLVYHRGRANDRTATYTITLTAADDETKKYVFKKTLKCTYERVHFDFYSNLPSGFYGINIKVAGDDVYIAGISLSFGGIIPESRKGRIGNVEFSSTNTMTVYKNKFVNGEFIFNVQVVADVSDKNLLRAYLSSSNSGDVDAYLPTENQYFTGLDLTDNKVVPMMWVYDPESPGSYLLRLTTEQLEIGHTYAANGILYMGRNDAVHEIIAQEY